MQTHSLQAIFRKIQYGEGFLLRNTTPHYQPSLHDTQPKLQMPIL